MLEDLPNYAVLQGLAVPMLSQTFVAADSCQAVPKAHKPSHGQACQEMDPLRTVHIVGMSMAHMKPQQDFIQINMHMN